MLILELLKIVYLVTIAFSAVGLLIMPPAPDIDRLITKKVDIRLWGRSDRQCSHGHRSWTYHSQEREKCIGGLFTGAY
jgi:hypothetical protein